MFLPMGDDNTGLRRVPLVTLGLIALNVLAFVYELALQGSGGLEEFLRTWSVIPAAYSGRADLGGPVPWTILTAMFLHGGWAHLIGNMVYLGIFGDNVENAFGRIRFLLFYLACGILGSIAHVMVGPGSTVPSLGASGAISGVLAAYLMMFPHNRVLVLVWFSVRALPALLVIGLWAVFQFASGAGSLMSPRDGGGVAYLAHVGGFLAGFALTPLLGVRGRPGPRR